MSTRIYVGGKEVDPIDELYSQWDGRPLTSKEMAEATGINESTIRATYRRAFKKLRQIASPAVLEYAGVDDD